MNSEYNELKQDYSKMSSEALFMLMELGGDEGHEAGKEIARRRELRFSQRFPIITQSR